jgi:FkbM family methyltransferase
VDLGYVKGFRCENGEFVIVNARGNEVRVKYDTADYYINGFRFKTIGTTFIEIFLREDFYDVDVKDRDVVDVGAYVGDSSIYFIQRGAFRVIAIEPHPFAYDMLDYHAMENNLLPPKIARFIKPVNAGLASKPGRVCVDAPSDRVAVTYFKPGDCRETVPAITLGELINMFNIDPSEAVLKMDCEGCEYDVILNDYEHVRLFREVVFEYHGDPTPLLNVLVNDFDCKLTRLDGVGFIHCLHNSHNHQ